MLAARRIRPDGARLHVRRPLKRRLEPFRRRLLQHLNGRLTSAHFTKIHLLLNFFFCHHAPFVPLPGVFIKTGPMKTSIG
jgi:hypothetical protein